MKSTHHVGLVVAFFCWTWSWLAFSQEKPLSTEERERLLVAMQKCVRETLSAETHPKELEISGKVSGIFKKLIGLAGNVNLDLSETVRKEFAPVTGSNELKMMIEACYRGAFNKPLWGSDASASSNSSSVNENEHKSSPNKKNGHDKKNVNSNRIPIDEDSIQSDFSGVPDKRPSRDLVEALRPSSIEQDNAVARFEQLLESRREGLPWTGKSIWRDVVRGRPIKVYFTIERFDMAVDVVYRLSQLGGKVDYRLTQKESCSQRGIYYSAFNYDSAKAIELALWDVLRLELIGRETDTPTLEVCLA